MPRWTNIASTLLDAGLVFYKAGWKFGETVYDLTHPDPGWGDAPPEEDPEEEEEEEDFIPAGVDEDGDFYPE